MPTNTTEQALEAVFEKKLTGISLEEIKANIANQISEPDPIYRGGNGYYTGYSQDFDARYAIDTVRFWHFLESTQAEELEKIKKQSDWQLRILERMDRMIKKYGILRILRKGLEIDDAHFIFFYELPLASSSETIRRKFESNQFSVSRQIRYSATNPREEIDMVIFINGLPIATFELKNHWTGQNARVHGMNQYCTKRDITQPLLNFGRCIVHFTVDTEEAYMTTKLDGYNTFFLPFNLGNNFGKGNPVNVFGHRTSYLWEEVLTRQSLANIIQHFVRFDGKDSDPLSKKNLYFPRYHQMDVVRRLVEDTSKNGVGKNYLIQHSAGSGKSNSITWTAYQLIETYPENDSVKGSRGMQNPLFDSVIVVTDRRLLDKQLRENINSFSEVKNIIAPAFSAKELKDNLENGKRIIITTIQKFPFIVDGIADLSDKRFAVIIDEAHSSQSGSAADDMNRAIARSINQEEEEDIQDKIIEAMRSRKMRGNASYFAFTATPKNITLEKFGVRQTDGSFKPFHLYSMKQAIEEGFILDVLANYTTYKSYYEIEKSVEDNPLFETTKAQKRLKKFVEQSNAPISTKADVMLEHFISKVVGAKKLKGKAKGMVVTQSIESAIRYYFALKRLLEIKSNPFKIVIAFSGKKLVYGIEYTEDSINGFPEKDTKDKFNEDDYKLLVVANKYLTGFDQPKLTTMYVDKKLQGVLAVQALSRLNRAANKLGKRTEDLFILDFFNSTEDIKAAFDPFYTSTTLSQATDVNVLHDLKAELDEVGVYEWEEVEEFVERYFAKVDAQELSPIIDTAADRFNHDLELEDEQKADFKIKSKQFVKIYGQMAAILPYEMIRWEKLFWFLKYLIPKLIVNDPQNDAIDELLESVDLSTYGLERNELNVSISLDENETALDPQNPNLRGVHGEVDFGDLDTIINNFNQRWFQGWEATPEEQRVKFLSIRDKIISHPDFEIKYKNNSDEQNRNIALVKMFEDVLSKQRRIDIELYRIFAKDDAAKMAFLDNFKWMFGHRY